MSFNLRYGTAADGGDAWPLRREFVADVIEDFAPDVLGTQECLAMQAAFLRERLPAHGFVGVGRDDGAEGGEMCAVFFRADRFRKLDEGHFWLSETPDSIASKSWDSALTRMATWVRLAPIATPDNSFLVVNTHFDHVGAVAREMAAYVITERVADLRGNDPVVIMGDFNAPADRSQPGPYRVFTQSSAGTEAWIDTYRALHPASATEGTFNGFGGRTGGDRIDWILVDAGFAPVTAEIVRTQRDGRYPSDHFPVTAVLRWR